MEDPETLQELFGVVVAQLTGDLWGSFMYIVNVFAILVIVYVSVKWLARLIAGTL